MSYDPCEHLVSTDHQPIGAKPLDGKARWICSNCKKVDLWGPTWGYYGKIECKKCWAADMEWVACSDECYDKLRKRR